MLVMMMVVLVMVVVVMVKVMMMVVVWMRVNKDFEGVWDRVSSCIHMVLRFSRRILGTHNES